VFILSAEPVTTFPEQEPAATRPRILFLFSDTGGGHRASASAVLRAMDMAYPGRFDVELFDPFVESSRPFLGWLVYRYAWLIKNAPSLYSLVFHATDNKVMTRLALRIFGRQFRPGFRKDLAQRRADAVVSFHPLLNHVVLQVMDEAGPHIPFITVITDMSEFHRFWMAGNADLIVVPSRDARRYCIERGVDPRKVMAVGLPVDPRFTGPPDPRTRPALRARLGLQDRATLLMMGGGEGTGRLGAYARALDKADLGVQLVIVCGRNERLKKRLEAYPWHGPVHVFGFVDNMPELMQASDAVVTKAGPGTISEALISGLPLLLTSFVPGQEEGNVKFVQDHHLGWYTPRVKQLVRRVRWAFGPGHEELERMKGRAETEGRPDAASEIATLIAAAAVPATGAG